MNQPIPKKKSSATTMLIILALIAVPTCVAGGGIVAAVAIPAFLRYIKVSKVAEAQAMTRQIAQTAQMHFTEHCEFPTAVARHVDPADCCGGAKCLGEPGAIEAFDGIGVNVSDPTYFAYETRREGNAYRVIATADFTCGGPMHTVEVVVQGTANPDGSCETEISPARVQNELE